jgi:hypothetical protein
VEPQQKHNYAVIEERDSQCSLQESNLQPSVP